MKSILIFIFLFSFKLFAFDQKRSAEWNFSGSRYINNRENYGHRLYFSPKAKTILNNQQSFYNQIIAESDTTAIDLSTKTKLTKKNHFNLSLGENYYTHQSDNQVFQIGYQHVVWGETFGFNYADLINPKNYLVTDPYYLDQTRKSIPLAQWKYFADNFSFQILTTFAHDYNRTLPLELFTANLFNQSIFNIEEDKATPLFDDFETGFKASTSFWETDFSLFFLNYENREAFFTLKSATASELNLKKEHQRLNAYGFNIAKTFYDFVFRADTVFKDKKAVNYLRNLTLLNYTTTEWNSIISIDTPTYQDFNFTLIYAYSKINAPMPQSFRKPVEDSIITKLSKNLLESHKIESSLLFDLKNKGQAFFLSYMLPVKENHEFKISSEMFKGPINSKFNLMKANNKISLNLNSVFEL